MNLASGLETKREGIMLTKTHRKWIDRISKILFVIYLLVLAYFLFLSERYGRSYTRREYHYNLTLFKEIIRFMKYRREIGLEGFVVNIFGNVLAFAPFGYVLAIINVRSRKLLNIALLSMEFSLTIEITQLLLRVGTFDVDDLLLNTVGGVLGYIAFYMSRKVVKRKEQKKCTIEKGVKMTDEEKSTEEGKECAQG